MEIKVKCAVTGLLAGAINGFFGAGGGMVLVPLLVEWAQLEQREAFATSVAVILPLCAVSAGVYFLRGQGFPGEALPYLLGGLIGGVLGGVFLKKAPVTWLCRGFGVLILYGGVRALW